MTYEKSLFIGRTVLIVMVCLLIGVALLSADHSVKKGGYDLYWKNRIALADDDAFVNDSLVGSFLDAKESLELDAVTGEFTIGSERRGYSPDHQIGWLLQVTQKAEVKNAKGQINKIYSIKSHLVFDLRTEGKK